ncbi:MAG TPA: hypothetical protein PKA28_15920 [Methylomusa anaerophila]|uniref:Uncharacterized protein n=1 Tax=Methylomusa anaerophila TaxID=1930071 RepID=A0A348AK81_9FIRM|nr:hypothetical protein [Methylomusa anaerophila]BBB91479.1 hypothetical protein MAMMFC1_02163 [Methylomusa anaerophila]HML89932.1 hypothetical protein [Methylomusa anaerophila]
MQHGKPTEGPPPAGPFSEGSPLLRGSSPGFSLFYLLENFFLYKGQQKTDPTQNTADNEAAGLSILSDKHDNL